MLVCWINVILSHYLLRGKGEYLKNVQVQSCRLWYTHIQVILGFTPSRSLVHIFFMDILLPDEYALSNFQQISATMNKVGQA